MATVGLFATETDWAKPCAVALRAGIRRWVFPVVVLGPLVAATGCSTFASSHGPSGVPAGAGDAPLYVPQTQAAAPPPAAAAPAIGSPSAAFSPLPPNAPSLALAPSPAPPSLAPAPRPFTAARPELQSPPRIQINPGVVVAPLNANVILVAGVYGVDRQLLPFQRVDWTLAPGSVGQIITVGDSPGVSVRGLAAGRPNSLSPNYAVGQTFGENLVITRGTSSAHDDLTILRGQTWIGLTSSSEGDTVVTALGPEIADPAMRQQSAVVHWVDVRWLTPPAGAALPGSRIKLTTQVTRASSGAPLAGSAVRYIVSGGPPAAFAGNGLAEIETPTDALGQSTVELTQPTPVAGVNLITVRLTRPATPGGDRLEIGSGATQITWTTNPPPAASAATPQPALAPSVFPQPTIRTPMQPLAVSPQPPAISPSIVVPPQPTTPPATSQSASASGQSPSHAPAVPAAKPVVDLQFMGPDRTFVGGQVTFDLILINRTDAPATGLTITDRFDDGLVHAAGVNPIQKSLESLAPHETRGLSITFKVTRPGRLCNLVELSGDNGLNVSAQACVESEGVRLNPTPVTPNPATPNPRVANPSGPASIGPVPRRSVPAAPIPSNQNPNSAVQPPMRPPASAKEAANLQLLIASRGNPIKTGKESSYQIVVTNQGTEPEAKVALAVTIPPLMQFVGNQDRNPSAATIDGQTVRFDPVKQLQPRESLVFEIHVRADVAGNAVVRAEVTSANLASPIVGQTTTTVFAEP